MAKLKADVRAPEFIHRNRKFQQFRPPGTVVMIKYKGVVFARWWLSRAKGNKILTKETGRLKTASLKDSFTLQSHHCSTCLLPKLYFPSRVCLFNSHGGLPACQGWALVIGWTDGQLHGTLGVQLSSNVSNMLRSKVFCDLADDLGRPSFLIGRGRYTSPPTGVQEKPSSIKEPAILILIGYVASLLIWGKKKIHRIKIILFKSYLPEENWGS
jgi:hypothetical protein